MSLNTVPQFQFQDGSEDFLYSLFASETLEDVHIPAPPTITIPKKKEKKKEQKKSTNITLCEHDIDRLFNLAKSQNLDQSFSYLEFESREGRNRGYVLSNYAANFIHKSRRVHGCIAPITEDPNAKIIVNLKYKINRTNHYPVFLSRSEKKTEESGSTNLIFNCNPGTSTDIYFYLHTDKKHMTKDLLGKYTLELYLSKNGSRQELYSFSFELKKDHKYDSSKKGKAENEKNAVPIFLIN